MSRNEPDAIVVTGSSTGIGRACALALARQGKRVFAGVRRHEDADSLAREGFERLEPVFLDVTDPAQVVALVKTVESEVGPRGLLGLVNNAGIAVPAPLEYLEMDELRRQMEVNFFAAIGMTQALLPSIRKRRGRIVNISSIGGRVASPLLGAYNASKFALEAVSDSLRQELRPWGIQVAVVEPGTIDTPIFDKSTAMSEGLLERMPAEGKRLYQPLIDALRAFVDKSARNATPPEKVADAVCDALLSDAPRTRYLVGTDAKIQATLRSVLPDTWMDAAVARLLALPRSLD